MKSFKKHSLEDCISSCTLMVELYPEFRAVRLPLALTGSPLSAIVASKHLHSSLVSLDFRSMHIVLKDNGSNSHHVS